MRVLGTLLWKLSLGNHKKKDWHKSVDKFKNQSMVPKNALNVYFGNAHTITSYTSSSFIPCTIKLVFIVEETRVFACTSCVVPLVVFVFIGRLLSDLCEV